MEKVITSLERKLNRIIDNELAKDISQVDDSLVMACCDGLLRMENVDRYIITESDIKKSVDSIIGRKSKTITKMTRSIKILLAAAIIMIMLAIGTLGYAQYKYNIFDFSDHSIVMFNQLSGRKVNGLEVGFIPEGFTLSYESNNKYEHSKEFVNGEEFFTISKCSNGNEITINTEYQKSRVMQIDGIDYIEYGEAEHGQGVVWEEDGYKYIITGNISSQRLLEIALSTGNN